MACDCQFWLRAICHLPQASYFCHQFADRHGTQNSSRLVERPACRQGIPWASRPPTDPVPQSESVARNKHIIRRVVESQQVDNKCDRVLINL